MSVANGNHILFCFEHSYYISPNKIGILLHHVIRNFILYTVAIVPTIVGKIEHGLFYRRSAQ